MRERERIHMLPRAAAVFCTATALLQLQRSDPTRPHFLFKTHPIFFLSQTLISFSLFFCILLFSFSAFGSMADPANPSSSPPLPTPPCHRSPPRYPDFYGKHRKQAELQILNREIGFLKEELQSVGGLKPASSCCKEIDEFVGTNPDPLIPLNWKIHRPFRIWNWLCGCSFHLRRPCCACDPSRNCQCCCRYNGCCGSCLEKSCCRSCCCVLPSLSCPDCSCHCVSSCMECRKVCHCLKCTRNCCLPCCLCS